jgi:hypothetical protein
MLNILHPSSARVAAEYKGLAWVAAENRQRDADRSTVGVPLLLCQMEIAFLAGPGAMPGWSAESWPVRANQEPGPDAVVIVSVPV